MTLAGRIRRNDMRELLARGLTNACIQQTRHRVVARPTRLYEILQSMHSFEVSIRICQPEKVMPTNGHCSRGLTIPDVKKNA